MTVGTAAILAGGEGRRLGGLAKDGLVAGGGAPLGPRLAGILAEGFARVLVVTRRPELYAGGPATPLADLVPGFGPLSGLHAALSALVAARSTTAAGGPQAAAGRVDAGDGEWLWLAACDMPAFDTRLVGLLSARLEAAMDRAPADAPPLACLARYGGHFEPFHALYSTRLLPRLEALFAAALDALPDGQGKGGKPGLRPSFKELFAGLNVEFVPEAEVRAIDPDWSLFFNINRPEDLERYASSRGDSSPPAG